MEQIPMNFDDEMPKPALSERDLMIQDIMDREGPAYKDNREAAAKLADIRLKHKKSGGDTVSVYPPLDN